MKSKIIGLVLLAAVNCMADDPLANWEAQFCYDVNLENALITVVEIVGDFPQKCGDLITDKVDRGFGYYRKHDIGEEIRWSMYEIPYSYYIIGVSPSMDSVLHLVFRFSSSDRQDHGFVPCMLHDDRIL